jgi:hypothetical protein
MQTTTLSIARPKPAAIALIALAAALLLALVTPSLSEARVGDVRAIPSHKGSGTVALDSSSGGRIWWSDNAGARCSYIQIKHVAVLGVDSTWDRLTSNVCSGSASAYWSKPTSRAFNGYKFRICQDQVGFDECGGSVTIYK